jgi:hypothetical protein
VKVEAWQEKLRRDIVWRCGPGPGGERRAASARRGQRSWRVQLGPLNVTNVWKRVNLEANLEWKDYTSEPYTLRAVSVSELQVP